MTYSPRARAVEILRRRGLQDAEAIAQALDTAGVLDDEPAPCPAYVSGETIVIRCYLPAGHDGVHVTAWESEGCDRCDAFDDLIGHCDRYYGHPGWHGRETALGATLIWPASEMDEALQAATEDAACCTYHEAGGALGHECSPDYVLRRRDPIRRERP